MHNTRFIFVFAQRDVRSHAVVREEGETYAASIPKLRPHDSAEVNIGSNKIIFILFTNLVTVDVKNDIVQNPNVNIAQQLGP